VGIVTTLIAALFAAQIIMLAFGRGNLYAARAQANLSSVDKVPAPRGLIYDRNNLVIADNKAVFLVFLKTKEFLGDNAAKAETIKAIHDVLGLTADDVAALINDNKGPGDVLLAEGIPQKELIALQGLNLSTLTFQNGSGIKTTTVDHVVLAIPFSMLRGVNYSKAGFEPLKVTAIKELPMGTNSKLHVQFKDRFWYGEGNNGNTYADTGYQNTWEVTRGQGGGKGKGILVDYTGGEVGASFGSGKPVDRAQQFLDQLAPQFPDVTLSDHWDGKAESVAVDYWAGYPWTKGSYSYWKVGQYTKFSGMEKERQGNCHFCGEHTSQDFQGYLNGGVETGERAAGEILGDLKHA